jgi:hypothetical protein
MFGSSFSGLFTRVEKGHIRMGLAGKGRINWRGSDNRSAIPRNRTALG